MCVAGFKAAHSVSSPTIGSLGEGARGGVVEWGWDAERRREKQRKGNRHHESGRKTIRKETETHRER